MQTFFITLAAVAVVVLIVAQLLTVVGRFGVAGRAIGRAASRAPGLDAVVFGFTVGPAVCAVAIAGWAALPASLLGQLLALYLWTAVQEVTHRRDQTGPRIVDFLNRTIGRLRNHIALIVTLIALPVFLLIRVLQVIAYPLLIWLLRFPRYRQAEWINVSRQKFDGLIGHDLIWCLYCDWMTGVYALGAEMLRNVESFWCPIRFLDPNKCENCRVDFPDIDGGWVGPGGSMHDVQAVMEEKYGTGRREWFGHPARLTVEGKSPGDATSADG